MLHLITLIESRLNGNGIEKVVVTIQNIVCLLFLFIYLFVYHFGLPGVIFKVLYNTNLNIIVK